MARAATSKYQPLADCLARQSGTCLTLTFTQLADLLGSELPRMAWTKRWWANSASGRPTQAHAWLSVGWQVDRVDARYGETVTFVRQDLAATHNRRTCPTCRAIAAG